MTSHADVPQQVECVPDREGVLHATAGPADHEATWVPIACGEGIGLPYGFQRAEPTCEDCREALRV